MGTSPNIAQLLLDLSYSLEIGRSIECISSHKEKLDQVSCNVATSDIQPPCQMRKSKAIVYGYDMCHTVARIDHDTRGKT